jgi:deazaflavin-dependent oxidoreductase (nitroreductase family)
MTNDRPTDRPRRGSGKGSSGEGRGLYRLKRWMYRSGRPNLLARILNWPSGILHATGILVPKRWVTLEVRGRRSGKRISFPLVAVDHEGERYLVSMLGEGTNWVRNVRAAGGRAVLRHRRREAVRLEDVEPGARPPILRRYLALAPGARPHLPVGMDDPPEAFEQAAAQVPVFRVVPDHPDDGAARAPAVSRRRTPG